MSACSPEPARHGTGAQVRDEGPGAPDRQRSRHHRIDVDETRQAFGHCLDHRSGERRGRGGAGLGGRQQQHRHAAARRHFEAAAGILGPFHRRHDEAVGLRHEGPRPPRLLAARHRVEDLEAFADMIGRDHAGADMLPRCGDAGIERVDVEIVPGDHVARHHRALVEVDMLAAIDDAPGIIEVDQQRLAIGAGGRLDNMDGGTGSAEMDLVAPWLEIVLRVSPAQLEHAWRRLRSCPRRARGGCAAVHPRQPRSPRRHGLDAGGDGIGEADRFEEPRAPPRGSSPCRGATAVGTGRLPCRVGLLLPRWGSPAPGVPARLAAAAPAR